MLPEDGASPFDGGGWPGGVKQQFAAVRSMVEATLMQLKQRPEFRVHPLPNPPVITLYKCVTAYLEHAQQI